MKEMHGLESSLHLMYGLVGVELKLASEKATRKVLVEDERMRSTSYNYSESILLQVCLEILLARIFNNFIKYR